MNYWLDCFTGTTWREFQDAGSSITGFNARFRKHAASIAPGDIFLCYLIGVKRWVGALEVIGPSEDDRRIWHDAEFPVRFDVKPTLMLDPEHGVPMDDLEGKVSFYAKPEHKGGFQGFVRLSPNLFKRAEDARLILKLLEQARNIPLPGLSIHANWLRSLIFEPKDKRERARKPSS